MNICKLFKPKRLKSFNKNCWENIENQGADVSDYIKKYIRIKLIPLKKNSSVTMISKMKKKNIDSSKYLNDIWSKDKLLVWYLDNDIKLMLLKIREKNLKESPFDAIINDDLGLNNE